MGLEEFLPWGIGGAAAKRLAGDSWLDYGGARVLNGVLYIVLCFLEKDSLQHTYLKE